MKRYFCAGTQQQPMIQDSERFPQPSDARPSEGTWAGAFGIKHLSDAEWEEHERERQAKFDQRHAGHTMSCFVVLFLDAQCSSCTVTEQDLHGAP